MATLKHGPVGKGTDPQVNVCSSSGAPIDKTHQTETSVAAPFALRGKLPDIRISMINVSSIANKKSH